MKRSLCFHGLVLAGALLLVAGGCSRPQYSDFVPQKKLGAASLEAYLKAWARGNVDSAIPDTNPLVLAVDGRRQKGRTLRGYRILGPTPSEAPLCFAVQLKLGNPDEEIRERYVVIGNDPLWVWLYDDYLMITHWDHRMVDDKKAQTRLVNRGSGAAAGGGDE